mmetsp:Transcript_66837/g.164767  ORF Transcript_66837/g.164767 Transcript_66837/m.164767 type:complete len:272 (-) Transcript_66837:1501-2316(-)
MDALHVAHHLLHDRHHGRSEGDIVDKRRKDGRGPHDDDNGHRLARLDRDSCHKVAQKGSNGTEQAKLAYALDDDEEGSEEKQSVPLDTHERLVTVVQVKRDEEPHSAKDRHEGGVDMGDGMQEEAQDDAAKHDSALDEEGFVCDGVHLLEGGDVGLEGAPHLGAVVPPEEHEDEGRGEDHAGSKVDEESSKVEHVTKHVPHNDIGWVADHCGSASNVGEDALGDQERAGVDVDELAQLARDGGDEENGGHVVQEGGEHSSDGAEQEEEADL